MHYLSEIVRPVSYQDFPKTLLHPELQNVTSL